MASFDILSIVGDPWDEESTTFGGIKLAATDAGSTYDSRFLEFILNGATRFTMWKTGEFYLQNEAGTSYGGIGMRGDTGAMALTSQLDPNNGRPADVVRWGWDSAAIGSAEGSVAVLHGMGKNRLSIESEGAIVHIANNGRYEFETKQSGNPLQFVAYSASSSEGVPFLFTNHGQSLYPESVIQVGVDQASQIAFQTGLFTNGEFNANSYIDGSGSLYARNVSAFGAAGSFRGLSSRVTGEVTARIFLGLDKTDNAFLGFGLGNAALDSYIYRAGPNLFAIGGAASAARPAIKGIGTSIQGRLADDSDFCTVQGKLTTDQGAVSETVTPDSTLTLYDASGTAYKVPCVAA